MKKVLTLALVLALGAFTVGCGGSSAPSTTKTTKVVEDPGTTKETKVEKKGDDKKGDDKKGDDKKGDDKK